MSLQPRYSSSSLILVTTNYYDSRGSISHVTTLSETLFWPKKQQEDEQLATNEDWLAGESVCRIGGSRKEVLVLFDFVYQKHSQIQVSNFQSSSEDSYGRNTWWRKIPFPIIISWVVLTFFRVILLADVGNSKEHLYWIFINLVYNSCIHIK